MIPTQTDFDLTFLETFARDLENAADLFRETDHDREEIRRWISAYTEILSRNRKHIRAIHDQGGSGRLVCELFGAQADSLIAHFARTAFEGVSPLSGLSIVALGGYGRNELNPLSDIDILILLRNSDIGGALESRIQAFLQNLWDVNLQIGHSVRTIPDCLDAVKHDLVFSTALLESRLLWGDPAVLAELKVSYRFLLQCGEGETQAIKKIDERNTRLMQNGMTVNTRTPNIKESPGGLRDIHTIRWIQMYMGTGDSLKSLLENDLLNELEYTRITRDFDFLLRARNAVHFITGKKIDRLEPQHLLEIAANLRYSGSRVELTGSFMRDYYSHASDIFRLTNHIIGRLRARFEPPILHDLRNDTSELVIIDSRIGFSEQKENQLQETPDLIMRLFFLAAQSGLQISEYAAAAVERAIQKYNLFFVENAESREVFREMVDSRKNLAFIFRQMHEHGVLNRLIPEFESILWHYQYSYYHAYTTDEHSLKVVENIGKIENGELSEVPELTGIMGEVTAKGALYLAGLLHDIGKAKGHGHAIRGARMAAQALQRLGFDDRTVHLVRFLIQEHLLMTHISQRRDMEEESTITDFVRKVGDAGRLKMLTILTFSDLMAVSDTALNDWKKSLLFRLYSKAMRYFDRGFERSSDVSGDLLVSRVRGKNRGVLDESLVRDHLNRLPEQYGAITSPADIRRHLAGISRLSSDRVWASFSAHKGMTLLTVITRDHTSALLDICGTITASDINIVAAQIFTRDDGIIIDTFLVVDCAGSPLIAPEVKREFKDNLRRVIGGEIMTRQLIQNHIRRWCRRRKSVVLSPPKVSIHNDISENFTVIDVFSNDFTGLLFEILQVFANYGIDIHSAKIGSDEDQVADAFYVRSKGGNKIEDEKLLAEISASIILAIEHAFPITITE